MTDTPTPRDHYRAPSADLGDALPGLPTRVDFVGFWARTLAWVLDSILLSLVTLPLALSVYGLAYFESDGVFKGPMDIAINYAVPILITLLFWYYKGATPGKMAVGARIVDATTLGPPSLGQLVGRYFAYVLSILPLLLGFFWAGWDPRKQGWHDKLASTLVVRS